MNHVNRIARIKEKLITRFSPEFLEVLDESDKHIGHAGAKGGAGHYTIKISSPEFRKLSRVAAHREIYAALQSMMQKEIHALVIQIL